jgi:4-amino-4-deoxy-L-arabinose transferase-like glycosyltransferase
MTSGMAVVERVSATPEATRAGLKRLYPTLSSPGTIVLIALVLRLGTIIEYRTFQVAPSHTQWLFAFESGIVAGWIVSGHGFSSPYLGTPLPSAYVAPIYPLLLAGIFKVFGMYTNASAFVALALNSLFSALTCLMIFKIAKRCFGQAVALGAAWTWALFPVAIYWSTHFIHYTSLSTLLLSLVFWLTLRMEGSTHRWDWFALGLVWAVIFLTNPAVGSFMVVSAGWLAYGLRPRYRKAASLLCVSAVALALGLAPWVVRNYRVFGKIVLFRSDFGEELLDGNHEGGNGLYVGPVHWNGERMVRIGELNYMAERRGEAMQFIRRHPKLFAIFTLKRIGFFWCDVPEQGGLIPGYNHDIPHLSLGMNARHGLYFVFAVATVWGLWVAYRHKEKGTFLFGGLFLTYPLVYYITHCSPRYQQPILPEMLVLAVYLLWRASRERSTLATWLWKH